MLKAVFALHRNELQIFGSPESLTGVLKAVLFPENGLRIFGSPECLTGVLNTVFVFYRKIAPYLWKPLTSDGRAQGCSCFFLKSDTQMFGSP